jgi:hypothetical protein
VHRVFRFLLIISFPCYAIISVAILAGHAGGHAPHTGGGFVFAAFMAQFSVAAAYNAPGRAASSPRCSAAPPARRSS